MPEAQSPVPGLPAQAAQAPQDPPGIVAVLVGRDGREVAHAASFSRSAPAGFGLAEAQESRCRILLASAVMRALASPLLADNIDSYTAQRIVESMCSNGCRIVIVPVGH